jgi:hypothetical protein
MAGLLDLLKKEGGQYLRDIMPGGMLNPEWTPERTQTALSGLLDVTPVVGDIKSGYEGVQAARQGDMVGAGLGALGALPFIPNMAGVVKGVRPWEMLRKDYDLPATLKPQESFYEKFGANNVEIVRNPSQSELGAMMKEARREFPNSTAKDDPVLRHTEDADGNRYYWKANLGVHQHVEPKISAREGVSVDQNAAQKMSHRYVVRRALYDGETVPDHVLAEYPGIVQEVLSIKGNKIGLGDKYKR